MMDQVIQAEALLSVANAESAYPILMFFRYDHLPMEDMRDISKAFHDLAYRAAMNLPEGHETGVALRKLLEAKDCAVRAILETRR